MNRKLLIQVAGPGVVVGLVLFVVCLVGVWFTDRSQRNLNKLLSKEVASLQAAQELEIRVRQLRFRSFLNLLDPTRARQEPIEEVHRHFEKALEQARQAANSPKEREAVGAIAAGYQHYQRELVQLELDLARAGDRPDLHKLAEAHPIRFVIEPCQELLQINQAEIDEAVHESNRVSQFVRYAMIALGILGPLSGLVSGYSIARGLSRSIYQLSVRVQDMARHFDQTVASLTLPAGGSDLQQLDRQLHYVVNRVEEAAQNHQRHQREMLRAEQLAAVGQLAASVAHEVRNPLTSVKLLVEAAHRPGNRRALTDEDLEVIYREIVRLEATVQSFLDFARPPAPQRNIGDLREVVEQGVELIRARARQLNVILDVRCPETPAWAEVDTGQLCTVLVNLFINALDAMPGGGRLELQLTGTPTNEWKLTVADTGDGIPPAMTDRLFTPFASSKPTGTGLGLTISRRIVEEHGGRLAAANRPEGGACCTLTLPAVIREEIHAKAAGY